MTVSSDLNRISYTGNGTTTVFPVNYYFLQNEHLQVILISATGTETPQTLTANYTVTGAGNEAGGTVTMLVAPPTGTTLVIQREVPATQETDYLANDPFPAESHERALDKLTMLVQQNERESGRALKIPLAAVPTTSTELPLPQANKLLAWDQDGTAIRNFDPGTEFINVVGQQNSFADTFTGDGATTVFTLSGEPGSVANLDVSINGVTQVPSEDYTLSGNTLTFTTAPPAVASQILARFTEVYAEGVQNAVDVVYDPAGTGAVATNVQAKLRETVSVKDFGAVGDGVADDYDAILAAWNYCRPIGASLYFPSGTYLVSGERNYPFRNTALPVTSLLECNNMTIFGDGPSSILKTSSVNGADVLQLNGLKNFHVRNLQTQSVVSGSAAGSNGVSVTGGFDNITIDSFWAKNLAYVDQTTYVDGGKAVSIQPPSEANAILMGAFSATNVIADGCVYGFGYEPDNDLATVQPVSINVDIVAMNCREGVVFSAGDATSAISANSTNGVRIRGQSINCMKDIIVGRSFGIDIDMQIIQTKTAAELLLSYDGNQWLAADSVADVIGVTCAYAKNSRIVAYGNKKDCRHKVLLGGATDPNNGLIGSTENCDFYFDITGASAGVNVQFQDAGGNIMNKSRLYCTTSTAATLPIEFYDSTLDNIITVGPDIRVQSIGVTSTFGWTQADGRTQLHQKYLLSGNLTTRQTASSSADAIVEQWVNDNQDLKFAVRNDGAVLTAGRNTAASVATVKAVLPVYDESNVLVGYVPVYTTFS